MRKSWWIRKSNAQSGLSAASTAGALMMPWMPSAARTANQPTITGPKICPITPVPCLCMTNRPIRMTMVTGTTTGASDGASTLRPSIALSTEIAGVMAPSP